MRLARPVSALVGLVLLVSPVRAVEPEPWADSKLPVRAGLVFWLDATRQPAAHAAKGLLPPRSGEPIGSWFDGSGNRHHFVQLRAESQPRYLTPGGQGVVRFDGVDDAFERTGFGQKFDALTVFLVLAPRSNAGAFRGILSMNATGRRDYETGLNVDLGPMPGRSFDVLSIEGAGFSGAMDLLAGSTPFGQIQVIHVKVGAGENGVEVARSGGEPLRRARRASAMIADEVAIGARNYSNEPRPNFLQGFLAGDVAEVIVYDRVVDARESRDIESYLDKKHAALREALSQGAAAFEPPPFQWLRPGFRVRELPVKLTNVNNLRYRPDGKLLALTYKGDILLLEDRDGDGLEESVSTYWSGGGRIRSPIGMALTPPGYARGQGVFVAAKGKCLLIVDQDGDGKGDREIVVAEGWRELPHNVDALGITVGPDGSVYFGLGTTDFTNAYLVDQAGAAKYNLRSERGAILRVSPDFSKREIFCTGVRFSVGMGFNALGDLFCTDQEGATWLSNGNPFDELLHLRPNRHYGFPPRHSRWLNGVIDEPSTFDYRPQHQSTCGLIFNVPVAPGAPVFGPERWRGNAIVSGYSRGKLFRTELFKERGEYVARNEIVGIVGKLAADACVSPDGSLAVATHSGGPDWGSGPDGQGTLYKVRYDDDAVAQPLFAWSSGERSVSVAFDRPVDPTRWLPAGKKPVIEFGPAVAAGDRFETLRPGYAVVAAQLAAPRDTLAVRTLGLSPDRRTLRIETDLARLPVEYALTLPLQPEQRSDAAALRQDPTVDLAYDLSGVDAVWTDAAGNRGWEGWLPHLDLSIARQMTAGSAQHDPLWSRLGEKGTLLLRTRLDLGHMLRPTVQPGSQVDDKLPQEQVFVRLKARNGVQVKATGAEVFGRDDGSTRLSFRPEADRWIDLEVQLETGGEASLACDWSTAEDDRARAFAQRRFHVPWALDPGVESRVPERVIPPELAGGDRERGRALFFGDVALCSRCHTYQGKGGRIGPDLSNLPQRDYASVLKDIRRPSDAINPDYLPYTIALNDGRVLQGTVRTEGTNLRVGDKDGQEIVVARSAVEEMRAATTSIMPEGLPEKLGPNALRDLLTFLLTPGP
ncbi:MAG: hypothetical protein U0794_00980 [Isosphaeraceae bacterium]